MSNKPIPAVGLIRVSTPKQLKTGYGAPSQKKSIAEFAERNNLVIVEYVTEQKTGRTLDRKDVRRMRELAQQHKIKAVVIGRMDRLSRDLGLQIELRKEIQKLGLTLYSATRGLIDETNPEAALLTSVEGAFSQHEIQVIARNTKRGKMIKAQQGKWPGVGTPRYGYRRVGERETSALEIDPKEAKVAKRFFDLYNQNGSSLHSIADIFNREGIPGPGGGPWWRSTLQRMMTDSIYCGEIRYMGIIIPAPELAIISKEQFDLAQRKRHLNQEFAKRNKKRDYLFSGRVYCECGLKATGHRGKEYICASQQNYPPDLRCHYGVVSESKLLDAVWPYLRAELTPERLQAGLDESQRQRAQNKPRNRQDEIEEEIKQHRKKVELMLKRFGNETATLDLLDKQIKDEGRAIEALENERALLQADSSDRQLDESARRAVLENVETLAAMLDAPDAGVRARVLEALDVRLRLSHDRRGRTVIVSDVFGTSEPLRL